MATNFAGVAQRQRHLIQVQVSEGSNPSVRTKLTRVLRTRRQVCTRATSRTASAAFYTTTAMFIARR